VSAGGDSMAAYRVGLTGGLASGKSTVAGWLRDAGVQVVDADRLVAELYRPGAAGTEAARRLFGDGVLTAEGGVDHAALAARVFSDPAARRALEQAIHPLVRRRFEEIAATPAAPPTPPPIVLEATLLVEAGYGPGFDLIVTLEGDPEVRLRRAVARGLDAAAARARLAAQGDGARRRQGAHRVLDNDGTVADLRRQVDALIADVRRAAAGKAAAGRGFEPAPPELWPPAPPSPAAPSPSSSGAPPLPATQSPSSPQPEQPPSAPPPSSRR
jgi:dephospho-CoA kinase